MMESAFFWYNNKKSISVFWSTLSAEVCRTILFVPLVRQSQEKERFVLVFQDSVNTSLYRSVIKSVIFTVCRFCKRKSETIIYVYFVFFLPSSSKYILTKRCASNTAFFLRERYVIDASHVISYTETVVKNSKCYTYWNYSFRSFSQPTSLKSSFWTFKPNTY